MLQELLELHEQDLESDLVDLAEWFVCLLEQIETQLNEGTFLPPRPGKASPKSNEPSDVQKAIDRVIDQMSAAKRALGLTNKLKTPEDRRRQRSRVMSNMNKIRANLRRIEKMLKNT